MSRSEPTDLHGQLVRLVGVFRETLREAGETDTAERLPWLEGSRSTRDPTDRESLVQALRRAGAEELADTWGTISYEVFCLMGGNARVYEYSGDL